VLNLVVHVVTLRPEKNRIIVERYQPGATERGRIRTRRLVC